MSDMRLVRALDALVYGLAVTAVLVVVSAAISFPLGGGWPGVKNLLFVLGFALFGLASFQLRPTPPWREEDAATDERRETRFQTAVQAVPPLRWYDLPPDDRLLTPARLFLGSVLTLAVSFLMEAVLGVGV